MHKIALVGVGEIARNQHIPSIEKSASFELAAAVSRNASVDGIDNFTSLPDMLAARPDVPLIALCTPPQVRFQYAWDALSAGRHVLLEKPPGATLSEVKTLKDLADANGLTLYATWHSRHAPAVEAARRWLSDKQIKSVKIIWKEDVRHWHPGQTWIWQAGGIGVFDPGINALSILTHVLPTKPHVTAAELDFPANCETPIAARVAFTEPGGAPLAAEFDWRQTGPQTWDIVAETDGGSMRLSVGGSVLEVDGRVIAEAPEAEYDAIYARFADLLQTGQSDVDLAPLRLVADAFMLGKRNEVAPFEW